MCGAKPTNALSSETQPCSAFVIITHTALSPELSISIQIVPTPTGGRKCEKLKREQITTNVITDGSVSSQSQASLLLSMETEGESESPVVQLT